MIPFRPFRIATRSIYRPRALPTERHWLGLGLTSTDDLLAPPGKPIPSEGIYAFVRPMHNVVSTTTYIKNGIPYPYLHHHSPWDLASSHHCNSPDIIPPLGARPFCSPLHSTLVFLPSLRRPIRKTQPRPAQKYGKVVRLGPHVYSFDDPEAVKIIYGKGTEFDKSYWYEAWNGPGQKTMFSEPSVKRHGPLRRKFQHTYSMSSLVTYEGFVDSCMAIFKQRLEELAEKGREVDMARWFLCYAADTVAMITYSRRLGF